MCDCTSVGKVTGSQRRLEEDGEWRAESKGGCVVKLIGFVDSRDAPIRLHDIQNAHCGQGMRTIGLHDTAMVSSAQCLSFADFSTNDNLPSGTQQNSRSQTYA